MFCAVERSARPGAEREHVQALVRQLTTEHREVEDLWRRLRPVVQAIAAGRASLLRQAAVDLLVEVYAAHASFEEREFLPLARVILARDGNHMEALALALHMRQLPMPAGYI